MDKTYNEKLFSSFSELIDNCKKLYGNKKAFINKTKEGKYENITFSDFSEHFYRLCNTFLDMGLKDLPIAIIGKNSYEWVISYLAAATVGIAVPLDKELLKDDIESFLNEAECTTICSHSDSVSKIRTDFNVITFDKIRKSVENDKIIDYDVIRSLKPNKDDTKVIIFTSGTTGNSKGVCLSQHNILFNIYSTVSMVKIKSNDTVMSVLPLHHTYECTLGCLTVLSKGCCITYSESLTRIAKNISEYSPTILVVVPELLKILSNRIKAKIAKDCPQKYQNLYTELSLSEALSKTPFIIRKVIIRKVRKSLGGSLRLLIVGAAELDTSLVDDFGALGIRTLQGYGLTECSPLLAGNNDFYFNKRSTGVAIPFVELKIDSPNDEGIGEILAKGENIMLGYYKDEKATNDVFRNGWFCTGDLGKMDPDGALYITGRKKNVIVTEKGKNIYPEEIETKLGEFSELQDVIVVSEKDDGKILLKAKIFPNIDFLKSNIGYIPSKKEIEKIIHDIVNTVNKNLPSYKHIRIIEILDEALEKTTTRKIKRFGDNLS